MANFKLFFQSLLLVLWIPIRGLGRWIAALWAKSKVAAVIVGISILMIIGYFLGWLGVALDAANTVRIRREHSQLAEKVRQLENEVNNLRATPAPSPTATIVAVPTPSPERGGGLKVGHPLPKTDWRWVDERGMFQNIRTSEWIIPAPEDLAYGRLKSGGEGWWRPFARYERLNPSEASRIIRQRGGRPDYHLPR